MKSQHVQKTDLTSDKSESKKTGLSSSFFKSPRDMQLNSIDFLSRKDLINTAVVSKEFRELTFDAMSDEAVSYQALAKGQKIINEEKELDSWLKETLSVQSGLLALGKELITMRQVKQMADSRLCALMTEEGLFALREKLITVEQVIQTRSIGHVDAFLSPSGMIALREKLITVEQANQLPITYLDALLSSSGIIALREKLITVEQAKQMPSIWHVDALLSPNGIIALREGLMTVSQANQFSSSELEQALTNQALEVAREGRNNHAPGL